MPELRFHLAGLPVAIRAAAPDALDDLWPRYRDFPTTDAPQLEIEIERVAGFDRERGPEYPAFRRAALADGSLHVERFDAEGEITTGDLPLRARFRVGPSLNSLEACVRIALSLALPRAGALILHASSVEHAGRALVFTGPSGAGKSTISSMLADAFPSCRKLTDELTVLRRRGEAWEVYVPPFLSPAALPFGDAAPLASIHVLVQAPVHARDPLPVAAALPALLQQVLVYVGEPRTAARVLGLAADLVEATAVERLRFRKDPEVGAVLAITPASPRPAGTPAAPGPAVESRDPGRYPADLGQGAGADHSPPEEAP